VAIVGIRAERLPPEQEWMATALAGFFILRGERFRESGDPDGASAYFGMAAGVSGADPAVREKASRLLAGEGKNPPGPP
jgi:hypothetical protein